MIRRLLLRTGALWAIAAVSMVVFCARADAQSVDQRSASHGGLIVYVNLQSFGNGSIDLFVPDPTPENRTRVARIIAPWMNVDPARVSAGGVDEFDEHIPLPRRLLQPANGRWRFEIDSADLQHHVADAGYSQFVLAVCPPPVRASFASSRAPDEHDKTAPCPRGKGWQLTPESPSLHIIAVLSPKAGYYYLFLAAVALGVLLLIVLAWVVSRALHRRMSRGERMGIGIAAGGVITLPLLAGIVGAAIDAGPVANLDLARRLGGPGHVWAIATPTILTLFPGIVFVLLMTRRAGASEELVERLPLERPPAPPPPPPPP